LRIRYNAAVLQKILTQAADNVNLLDGSAVLLDEDHIFLAHSTQQQVILKSVTPFAPDKLAQLQAEGHLPAGQTAEELSLNLSELEEGLKNIDNQTSFVAETFDEEVSVDKGAEEVAVVRMKTQPWLIAFAQPQTTYLAPVTELSRTYILYNILIAMLIAAGAVIVSRTISNPVIKLTNIAHQIADGDMSVRIPVNSQDEIGTLADAFNKMTSQLQKTFEELDRRTKDHATVAEVGTATATIMQPQRLLQEVVELTKERFNLYHSHIYLLDEKGENLVLTAGAGEPGRIMSAEKRSIPLNSEQSLVARAARERKGVTVNDVTQAPDFLPNPLLPNTHSELAVPMIVSGNLIGVFDVQSDQIGRFTDADIDIQTTMAAQVATSIQNARSYERFKEHADLESLVNTIGQKIQRATTVEDTLQTAVREIGLALGAARVSANLQTSHIDDKTNVN
jgi:HAMP domain-containing protein